MTFDEFKENFDILFEMLTIKEKIKVLNILKFTIYSMKNSRKVRSLIRITEKEHEAYSKRKNFDCQLIDIELPEAEEDYDFMSQILGITNDSLQIQSMKRIEKLIKLCIISGSYYMQRDKRENFYQTITDLNENY